VVSVALTRPLTLAISTTISWIIERSSAISLPDLLAADGGVLIQLVTCPRLSYMTDDMRKVVEIVFVPIIRNVDSRRHQLSHLHPKVRRIVSNTICDLLEDVVDREVQDLGLFSG
jgi:hypothetical protein